jgi:hypothetical protein
MVDNAYTESMLRPDYQRSIVNLVTSLAGSQAPAADTYPPLAELQTLSLDTRPVVLLVIDGLGYEFLKRYPDSCLYRHLKGSLTSVFPTTTATAVTALALGVPAQQHAITGWFTYFRELGCVAAPLPFAPRGGGECFTRRGIRAETLLDASALLPRLSRPATLLSPAYIIDSAFSRALFGDVNRIPHRGLDEMFDGVRQALAGQAKPLVFAYWTEFDGLAHQAGIKSQAVTAHFNLIDSAFEMFLQGVEGMGAAVIVTADHGLIDTTPEQVIHLQDHPDLAAMLLLPLCGEPRAAYCYLREGTRSDFERYVKETFAGRCRAYGSEWLLEQGLFGRGEPSPHFRERIGDYLLMPEGSWIVKDRLLTERPFEQIGVHGGLSADELYVPLVVAEP